MALIRILDWLQRVPLVMLLLVASGSLADEREHREFEATLDVPYHADVSANARHPQARTFTLVFDNPLTNRAKKVSWSLVVLNPRGRRVKEWHGVRILRNAPITIKLYWDGEVAAGTLRSGVYQVHILARARNWQAAQTDSSESAEQTWDTTVGSPPKPRMPPFLPMSAPQSLQARAKGAPATFPYTVYLGNLHSQTNHSDGGGDLASCTGAQNPQTGRFGPAYAYAYARDRGLDILVASEHNHMYDGSDGTNMDADPAVARALFDSGLKSATEFSMAHPDFLAVYGLEWGVISGGGHLNIFNTPELLEWEITADGKLIGDTATPKGDYAALYTLMNQRGWVGQFNHPTVTGQFYVNGVSLGYTADGDQVMALCEVLNSFAFSSNISESETRRSNYEGACNKALEAGYHLAFSSDQDNHCANWGASYTNRTGVLIPSDTALTTASFLDALRARRVFATMDKSSQLVLTANGKMMGERFVNTGPLTLIAYFASSAGKTVASINVLEGVPGRNGAVTHLSNTAVTTITPMVGEHFYYVKATQNDGNILWSAPIWVTQKTVAGPSAPHRTSRSYSAQALPPN